jgi:hypothetical protein
MSTPLFQPVPSLMFVGEDDTLADECASALPHLSVLRVKHGAAAVERMVVTRPLVVVVDETVREVDVGEVVACAHDVGAEVFRASATARSTALEGIRSAALRAEARRNPPPPQ